MSAKAIVEEITELVEPVLDEKGFELVLLEYRREGREMVLRLYVDKEGGLPSTTVPKSVVKSAYCLKLKIQYLALTGSRCPRPGSIAL